MTQSIIADLHTHPYEKTRTKNGMRSFVIEAIKQEIHVIGFSDHGPMPRQLATHGMTEKELEDYVDYTQQLQKEFPEVDLKLGIELDYHPAAIDFVEKIIVRYPFDYVIGSVHIHTPGYAKTIAYRSLKEIFTLAFNLNIEAIKTGLFDILAHLDFCRWLTDPQRFGQFKGCYVPKKHYSQLITILQTLEKHKVCLEVNGSGLAKSFASILPDPTILSWANNYDLNYTFGSDAHISNCVGKHYKEVLNSLTTSQQQRLVAFSQRKKLNCI